jgi:hypothetical protein
MTSLEKPSRAERLYAKDLEKKVQRLTKQRANARRRMENYGARNGTPKRADAKRDALIRFQHRCLFAGTSRCETPRWRLEMHHWQRTVGAGATNAPEEVLIACAFCHSRIHDGSISREDVRKRLIDLGHITQLLEEETEAIQESLTELVERRGGRG